MIMTFPRLSCLLGLQFVLVGFGLCGMVIAQTNLLIPPPTQLPAPKLEQVRALAELTVLEVPLTLPVRHNIRGRTGGTAVVMLLQGSARLSTDLAQSKFVHVDAVKKHVTLALPAPTVHSVELDAESSQVLTTQRRGLWRMVPGPAHEDTAVTTAMREGQKNIHRAARDPSLIQQAKAQTETVLHDFLISMGWSVVFRWEDEPAPLSSPDASHRPSH